MTVKEHMELVKYEMANHEKDIKSLRLELSHSNKHVELWESRAKDMRDLYHKTRLVFCMQTMKYIIFNPDGKEKYGD